MIRRSTWIVFGLFVLAVVAFWYIQGPGKEKLSGSPTPTVTVVEKLWDLTPEEIHAVQIDASQGQPVRLERDTEGQWSLVEPPAEVTDTSQVSLVINQLTQLNVQTRLEQAGSGDAFGLEPPQQVITLETIQGQKQVLEVGRMTPIGNGYYVRKEGAIYVIGQYEVDLVLDLLANPPILATGTPVPGVTVAPEEGSPEPLETLQP
jgi:hypothetical protein